MIAYELTIVLPGGVSLTKKKTISESLEKMIKEDGGKLGKKEEWGKIDLAYKIGKETSGLFLHYNLELDKSKAKKLRDKLRMESGIIRYLLVKS